MIPHTIIEQIQMASDIVDVVSSYIPTKRAGRNFKALCPFHNEKTPSFFVNPEKQIWHCFGCGAGGSVFNFIMQYERVSFPEAVRLLGAKAGIEVPDRYTPDEEVPEKKTELYRVNDLACSWFVRQLQTTPAGKRVVAYLRKRGLSDRLIEEFSLGYAPDSWDALLRAARAKGISEASLLSLGLIMRKKGSTRSFDRFRNRLMVPIRNVSGRVVAFSGRVMDGGSPKYMNSPESIVFHKSRSLYGIHRARRAIVDSGKAIVVEGYFDLYALYGGGIENVVASQGTAFTADHARILKRYTNEVVMSFDADEAGESAALRSLDALVGAGLRVRILVLPENHDPDSFVRQQGAEEFGKRVEKAPEYFDFFMDLLCRRYNADAEVGKARVASDFLLALSRVPSAVLREGYVKKLSERLGISEASLLEEMKNGVRRQPGEARRTGGAVQPDIKLPAGEKEIVSLMLKDDTVARMFAEHLEAGDFLHEQLRVIAGTAFKLVRDSKWTGFSCLLSRLDDERCARVVSRLVSEEAPAADYEKLARDCIGYLKKRNRKAHIKRLREEICRMEKNGSSEEEIVARQRLLMQEKVELMKLTP
jgi:DNA primase